VKGFPISPMHSNGMKSNHVYCLVLACVFITDELIGLRCRWLLQFKVIYVTREQ
jgi:hypothetical protein